MRQIEKLAVPVILTLLVILCAPIGALENLVSNGGFEADELGMLSMWSTDAWVDTDEAVRFFTTEEDAHSGRRCFAIANIEPNDSRGVQWLRVKPATLYRLSAWVSARDVLSEKIGANISVLGSTSAAGNLKDTGGTWRYTELYGRTGAGQSALAVVVRLGFYGSLATGVALFDDVILEEIPALPEGARAISFASNDAGEIFPTESNREPPAQKTAAQAASPRPAALSTISGSMPWISLLTLAALAAATASVAGIALIVLLRTYGKRPSGGAEAPAEAGKKRRSKRSKRRAADSSERVRTT